MGLTEANQRFEEMQSDVRFTKNIELGEDVYDVYMAKKKSGKPKDGEPSKSSSNLNNFTNTFSDVSQSVSLTH